MVQETRLDCIQLHDGSRSPLLLRSCSIQVTDFDKGPVHETDLLAKDGT